MSRLAIFSIVVVLCLAGSVAAQPPAGTTDEPLNAVEGKTNLYPKNADATKEIETALKSAAAEKKRVMLIFGGNWCYDCHVLDQALHEGEAGKIVNRSFLLVHVNIGEGDKNLDVVKKYDATLDFGVPVVVILDSSARVIYSSTKGEFEAARRMMKKDLVAFLNQWKASGKVTLPAALRRNVCFAAPVSNIGGLICFAQEYLLLA